MKYKKDPQWYKLPQPFSLRASPEQNHNILNALIELKKIRKDKFTHSIHSIKSPVG